MSNRENPVQEPAMPFDGISRSRKPGLWVFVAAFSLLLVCLLAPLSADEPTNGPEAGAAAMSTTAPSVTGDVKWHPGHYAFVQSSQLNESFLYKHFQGVQKSYDWRTLEPEKDRYDLSAIRSDLIFLSKHEKRLVIQVQTKAFGAGKNCCPEYLSGPDFGGGVYKTQWGSFNPMIWDERVNRRLNALYQQLGKEFDQEPYLEAVVIPETAITGDIPTNSNVPYTLEGYTRSVEEGMQQMKDAFPHTVVIQYVNMPLGLIQPLAAFAKAHGVGFGGPDIYPDDPLLNDPQKGVYRMYVPLSGIVPLGAAVQQNDYVQRAAFRGPPGEPTVKEIYEFGRNKLRLNYIFWGIRKDYFEKVQAMMDEPAFPTDPAGGLNTTLPTTIKVLPGTSGK
jgi:hypothetical protein